jgi:hypothetical protein
VYAHKYRRRAKGAAGKRKKLKKGKIFVPALNAQIATLKKWPETAGAEAKLGPQPRYSQVVAKDFVQGN